MLSTDIREKLTILRVKNVRAVPMLKIVQPMNIAGRDPVRRIKNPDQGITIPCVIPQTDWTTMKSLYSKSGDPCVLRTYTYTDLLVRSGLPGTCVLDLYYYNT